MSEHAHREREHFFGAAKLVAALTMLSRVAGLVRDMAISSLGANRSTAAFILAFQVPNLFRRLFGEGALSGSFVPVFTDTHEQQGAEPASRLFANALGLMSVVLLGLMLLSYAALWTWRSVWPGEWDHHLLVGLASVTLPFMVTICLLALGAAALNCRGHFAYAALAPILLNVFIIAAAWGVAPRVGEDLHEKLYVISAAIPIAGVVQLAGVLWLLHRGGVSVRPRLRPIEPGIGAMARLMAPMMIGLGFLQISPFFDMIIIWALTAVQHSPTITLLGHELAKPLSEAAQMQVYDAQRLYQLPMGVLAISLGVVIFPLLSRYAARGDMDSLRHSLNRAVRLALFEGLATGTGLLVLAGPIMKLLFVRGRFTVADAEGAAFILQMYVLGMWAYCSFQILSRAFFALKEPKTPLKVACALVVLNVVLVAVLIWVPWLKAGAFGLATSLTASINVAILAVLLRRRVGCFGARQIAVSALRSLAASAVLAGAVHALRWHLERSGAADWMVVAACVPAGAGAFVATAWLLRAPELGELLGAARRKLAGNKPSEENV